MEIPYEVAPRRDTGLFNSKLGIWLFLASEVMLFGGLFSAYIFLRVGVIEGVDAPWPWGINVHKTFVVLGFVNTLVLIISSVFVVFGWIALKERNWGRFQMFMYLTVACAAIFMALKTVEYRSKLTQHHDIKLLDNSVLEGKILDKTFDVPFEGNSVEFNLAGSAPGFIHDIEGEFPVMKATWKEYATVDGERKIVDKEAEIRSAKEFKSWFVRARTKATSDLIAERKRYRSEVAAKNKALYKEEEFTNPKGPVVDTKAILTAESAFQLHSRRRQVSPIERSDKGDSMTYLDGSTVKGTAGDDRIKFEPHYLDMQLVPIHKQKDSMVWDVLGDSHMKDAWYENREVAYEHMEEYYEGRKKEIPESMLRGYYINIQSLHGKEHAKPFWQEFFDEFKAGAGIGGGDHSDHAEHSHDQGDHEHHDDHAEEEAHAAADDHGAHNDHGAHSVVMIPRDKIKFFNSHGPRNNNYYAIYFTMTALHGLHVIGGALVLLYFVVFGKPLFLRNPEHLANRVEVGGLFWHFVDLIWIFLFPLMYLL
ncbi:MAG: cytochrome c oxidase subunit 3 [Verrucomicrobiales bacterium]|nr:cytochrome c oxidase subunit 3 [Verrucomicrobiales bacterium]